MRKYLNQDKGDVVKYLRLCHCEEPQATKQSQNQDCFAPACPAGRPSGLAMTISQLSRKGFTLIEMVMVIVIVGTLSGVASMYIKETIDLWRFLSFRNEIAAQGRMAFERMSREIRETKLRTQTYEPIQDAQAATFRFIANDINGDSNDDDITFSFSGGNLVRTLNGVSNTLASNITSLQFCYYNKAGGASPCLPLCGCAPATLSDIYRIVIKMDISYGGQVKHLETQVYPRNLH